MRLLLVIGLIGLFGCGKGGDSASAFSGGNVAITPTPTPACKILRATWNSTTDTEMHTLGSLNLNSGYADYHYVGSNSRRCPDAGQFQQGKLYDSGSVAANAGFQYTMELSNNSPSADCKFWQDNPVLTHGSTVIKLECNKLTMCKTINALPGECKVFQ